MGQCLWTRFLKKEGLGAAKKASVNFSSWRPQRFQIALVERRWIIIPNTYSNHPVFGELRIVVLSVN